MKKIVPTNKNASLFFLYAATIFLAGSLATAEPVRFHYPLNLDDQWLHRWNPTTMFGNAVPGMKGSRKSQAVGDTTFPNGKTYRIVRKESIALTESDVEVSLSFVRVERQKVYEFNLTSQKEYLEYDFAMKPGDTIPHLSADGLGGDCVVNHIMVRKRRRLVFGKNAMVWCFRKTPGAYEEIADSIGLIYRDPRTGVVYNLKWAVIAGIPLTKPGISRSKFPPRSNDAFGLEVFAGHGAVRFSAIGSPITEISVHDVLGRIAWRWTGKADRTVAWTTPVLRSGTYIAHVKTTDHEKARRFTIVE